MAFRSPDFTCLLCCGYSDIQAEYFREGPLRLDNDILGRTPFLILINWSSHFRFKGCLSDAFHIYSNYTRTFCKKTVEILNKRCSLWRLIWVCTVFLCLKKGAGLLLGKPTDNHSNRTEQISAYLYCFYMDIHDANKSVLIKRDSNQLSQLQRLAINLKFRL